MRTTSAFHLEKSHLLFGRVDIGELIQVGRNIDRVVDGVEVASEALARARKVEELRVDGVGCDLRPRQTFVLLTGLEAAAVGDGIAETDVGRGANHLHVVCRRLGARRATRRRCPRRPRETPQSRSSPRCVC